MTNRALLLAAATLLVATEASAASKPKRVGTHPGLFIVSDVGVNDPSGSCYAPDLAEGPATRIAAGYRLSRHFAVEAGYFRTASKTRYANGRPGDQEDVSLDGRFFPFRLDGHRIEPSVLAGVSPRSTIRYPGERRLSGRSANAGLGVRFNSEKSFFVDVDVRWRFVRYDRVTRLEDDGSLTRAKCARQLHGDGLAALVGGGWQF